MSLLDSLSNLITPMLTRKMGKDIFYVFGSSANVFGKTDPLRDFEEIPEVNAVIGAKATFTSNGVMKVVNDNLEEQVDNHINKLLKCPNWFQAQKEFTLETKLFHEIFGNEYIYSLFPFGFDFNPERVKAIFTLPPNLTEPRYLEKAPFFSFEKKPAGVKYIYTDDGQEKELLGDAIIHLNDNRVHFKSMKDKHMLKGTPKLNAMRPITNNLRAAYESRGIILDSRGANGALTPDSVDKVGAIPLTPEEIDDLQKKFSDAYGTRRGQSQVIISNKALKWVQMGVNDPAKLGLFQETEEGFNKLCDAFGMATDLFARDKGATYENQKQAEKGTYIRTIIPEANEWAYALNQKYFPDGKLKIICDYSHLPIFQEDLKTKNEAMNAAINNLSKLLQDKQITSDEYRSELIKIGIGDGKAIPTIGDSNQQQVETLKAQAELRGSVGGVQGILAIQTAVSQGTATREAALATLTIIYGFTDDQASQILGNPQQSQPQS